MAIEYKKVVQIEHTMSEEQMNEYGKDGWDNYKIIGNVFWFKREALPAAVNLPPGVKIQELSHDQIVGFQKSAKNKKK